MKWVGERSLVFAEDMRENGGRARDTRQAVTDPDISRRPSLAAGTLYIASLVIMLFSVELTCGLEAKRVTLIRISS